ncbi:MAG: ABC transporter ATP-binding protein [Bacteroidetes bacterium]|nr:ABC transporter ATP-binding protein [Bacteroidota bacterium]MCL6097355.1 ABC transporter ATP-binding protein [Bacteroidota bacterium]
MTDYSVELKNLVKYFGRRLIFDNINFKFTAGNIYGISGPNGSGKSTLVKIIADLISPTRGNVIHKAGEKVIEAEQLHNYLGFVSPYLYLYDEFTAEENLIHFSNIRGIKFQRDKAEHLLNEVNLFERRNDLVRGYSSGMKQRLKFIFALLHNPMLLIFDEPTSNLDDAGKNKVYELISLEAKNNLVIVASNERADLAPCKEIIELEKFKR